MNTAESPRGSASNSRRPPVKVGGPCSYGWKDMPNNYNLSFLVSLNPPQAGGWQCVQLRDSGEATLLYVRKALSAGLQ